MNPLPRAHAAHLLLAVAVLGAMDCGSTGRTRRTFPVEVASITAPIVTDSGWAVSLTRASLQLEAIRFFEGRVLLAESTPWWRGLLVSEAWAHPGHYVPGEALGELIAPLSLDCLAAGTTAWGAASAVTGDYGSAQLTMGEAGLTLTGVATKGDAQVPFSAVVTPPATLAGLRFEHEMTTASGAVQVHLDLRVIFSRADFGQVGAGAAPLDMASIAFNGLTRGLEDSSAYAITWSTP